MKYTTEKIEQARANVVQTEQRIGRQRRRVEKLLFERHPADEAQAQLLIMEQSLISMTRFLKNLERDLDMGDLSLQRRQTTKRIHAAQNREPERSSPERSSAEKSPRSQPATGGDRPTGIVPAKMPPASDLNSHPPKSPEAENS
jgi:hypothetical protein